jgi:protein-S-isoprenylcysteine O-methyltransferase Ste14
MPEKLGIMVGWFLFRYRGFTPLPYWILLTALSIALKIGFHLWPIIAGAVLIISGEWIRMACVKRARSITRTYSDKTGKRVICEGLYRYSRNPIYIGNGLIGLGLSIFSGLYWAPIVFVPLFFIQYLPIILWEEKVLEERFGAEYLEYKDRVPRWIGRTKLPPSYSEQGLEIYGAGKILKSESNTLMSIIVTAFLLLLHNFV